MSTDTREERLARRIADLYANDRQFADARPSEAITAAIDQPGLRLPQIVRTVMEGYADRPALAQRAIQFVNDPQTGRTSVDLLPRFETTSYRELWDRVGAVATALAGGPSPSVRPGDRVCVLGFTSVDYTIIDVALVLTGAVCVPLQTSAPVTQLRPIVAETEPNVIAASVTYLDDAVELALTGHAPARLVVFDYHPEVDDQRETFDAARSRLAQAGSPVSVETLADVLDRGKALPAAPVFVADEDDPLTLLIYTSGSTGAPKGAMQPERLVANFWRKLGAWGQPHSAEPWITLSFMPMSHLMARGSLYGTLGNGGTAYFAAKSDLSTFLDDLALVRPTRLDYVPRIWDMLFGEFQSELDRRSSIGVDRAALEAIGDGRAAAAPARWTVRLGDDGLRADLGRDEGIRRVLPRPAPGGRLRLHRGRDRLRRWSGATPAGDRLQAGRRARSGLLPHRPATSQRRAAGQNGATCSPATTSGRRSPPKCSTPDGYYRTGDIMAEVGPDQLAYLDRRNNVLKLSQGEFVTVSKLEAVFGDSPLVGQIYVYGNSARAYLLAVVVPTTDALSRSGGDIASLKPLIGDSLKNVAKAAGLQSYEIPRDFIVETTPFTLENGLLTGIRKLARAEAQGALRSASGTALHGAGRKPGQRVARAAPQRCRPAGAGDHQPGRRRSAGRLGHRSASRRALQRPGRRLPVRVDVCQSAAGDLRHRRAGGCHREPGHRPAGHRRLHRGGADIRCEAADVCGGARPRRHRGARP